MRKETVVCEWWEAFHCSPTLKTMSCAAHEIWVNTFGWANRRRKVGVLLNSALLPYCKPITSRKQVQDVRGSKHAVKIHVSSRYTSVEVYSTGSYSPHKVRSFFSSLSAFCKANICPKQVCKQDNINSSTPYSVPLEDVVTVDESNEAFFSPTLHTHIHAPITCH